MTAKDKLIEKIKLLHPDEHIAEMLIKMIEDSSDEDYSAGYDEGKDFSRSYYSDEG